jgi:fumarate reductase flavoprotein subunit
MPRAAAPKHDLIRKTADLVVLGAGGSGLVAAVKAAQLTGKKGIVLEKGKKPGGNTNLGHGFMMRYSKWHQAAGIPDTREQFIEYLYKNNQGKVNYNLLKKATYGLSDMFDWLCEFGGAEDHFVLIKGIPLGTLTPISSPKDGSFGESEDKNSEAPPANFFRHNPPALRFMPPAMIDFPRRSFENLKCTDRSIGPGWMGTYVIRKMMEEGKKLGVEVYTEHRAVELLLNEKGEFTGVLAEDPGGQTRIDARVCIIATGGFAQSEEWMQKIRPAFFEGFPVHSFTVASNTGDGLTMVEKIGGQLDLETVKIPMYGPTHHPFNHAMVLLCGHPEIVMVNAKGKRFKNEGEPLTFSSPSIMEKLPNKIAWGIADDNTVTIMGTRVVDNVRDDPEQYLGYLNYREQLEEETQLDLAAKKANTLVELARLIGVPPGAFVNEIRKYNEFCVKGGDEDFGKDKAFLVPIVQPPFYALFLLRFNEGAEGGIVNDEFLRVLDTKNKPIPGLYTAGDCCRGLLLLDETHGKFGEMPWAMASGYLAGIEAARYISK